MASANEIEVKIAQPEQIILEESQKEKRKADVLHRPSEQNESNSMICTIKILEWLSCMCCCKLWTSCFGGCIECLEKRYGQII